jgi:hypothetical protein
MLYMRFSPVNQTQWEVTAPVRSSKPIASVTLKDGRVSHAAAKGRALRADEQAVIRAFTEEKQGQVLLIATEGYPAIQKQIAKAFAI